MKWWKLKITLDVAPEDPVVQWTQASTSQAAIVNVAQSAHSLVGTNQITNIAVEGPHDKIPVAE